MPQQKDIKNIKEHMEVLASDGEHVGTVNHLEGSSQIKLAKNDEKSGGKHHLIPVDWIDHVDQHIHLNNSSKDVMSHWKAAA